MNILVTGGAGFIGSNLCERLLKDGHNVWAVDNFLTGKKENLESLTKYSSFVFFECGTDTEAFLKFCAFTNVKFNQIYHLACPTGVPNIEILGEEMMDACSFGMKNVLTIARDHGARLVFTSSSEIYGNPEVTPQGEDYSGNVDPIGWRANYEEGKRFAETLVALFVKKYGVSATIVRLFNVYGPNMSLADFRVIPRFFTQALSGRDLTVHGDGSQQRTMCFVDDLVKGLSVVMEKGKVGEVYNLGGDDDITMLDLAKKVLEVTESESKIIFTPRATHDHDSRMPILDKVRGLGWNQEVSLEDGLVKTMGNFEERMTTGNASAMKETSDAQYVTA